MCNSAAPTKPYKQGRAPPGTRIPWAPVAFTVGLARPLASADAVAPLLTFEDAVELLADVALGHVLDFLGPEHLSDLLLGLVQGHARDVRERDVTDHGLLVDIAVEACHEHEAAIAGLRDDAGEQGADLHLVAPLCCSVVTITQGGSCVNHCYICLAEQSRASQLLGLAEAVGLAPLVEAFLGVDARVELLDLLQGGLVAGQLDLQVVNLFEGLAELEGVLQRHRVLLVS